MAAQYPCDKANPYRNLPLGVLYLNFGLDYLSFVLPISFLNNYIDYLFCNFCNLCMYVNYIYFLMCILLLVAFPF